jgi:hypothetical protein
MGFNTNLTNWGYQGGFSSSGITQGTIGSVTETTAGVTGSPATLTFVDLYDSNWTQSWTGGEYSKFLFSLDMTDYEYAPADDGNVGIRSNLSVNGWSFGEVVPGDFSITYEDDSSGHNYTGEELDSWKDSDQGLVYENQYFNTTSALGDSFVDGIPSLNEVQTIPNPNADGGTFTINGQTVDWDATYTDVQTALDTALGVSVVVVTSIMESGGPWTVTWNNPGPQSLLTVNGTGLTKS